jgi:alcohol dehydrogenase (cytochrome c)
MYVTSGNECYALDAGTGRQIWHYQRQRTKGQGARVNRGAALAGDRVFMVTDDARVIALNRFTGELLWDTVMADYRENYFATSAPLIAGDLVIPGIGGGDSGVRGFLAAFDQRTGKEAWRFWTIPAAGEAGSETWNGKGIAHPGGATWFTGSYDPELKLLYWQVGNPGPDHNGDQREGDNLYSDSVVALDVQTGKLKWHYQFTPHDVWDWDAQEPLVLADTVWQGQPRKLMFQANRNGFFYVLDRTNGKLLLGKPFANKVTWAKEIAANGRPVRNPDQEPTEKGTRICPAVLGATDDRELRDLLEAGRRVGSGARLHGREFKERTERSPKADPARARYQDGKSCVGVAAGWIRRIPVRHIGHRRRLGFLWRG